MKGRERRTLFEGNQLSFECRFMNSTLRANFRSCSLFSASHSVVWRNFLIKNPETRDFYCAAVGTFSSAVNYNKSHVTSFPDLISENCC